MRGRARTGRHVVRSTYYRCAAGRLAGLLTRDLHAARAVPVRACRRTKVLNAGHARTVGLRQFSPVAPVDLCTGWTADLTPFFPLLPSFPKGGDGVLEGL